MNWRERISINPRICNGKACIKGTRVMVSVILDNLAEDETYEAIMDGYRVTREDIHAALAYAADLAEDRYLELEHGVA
jgi:uncharacterized protein (DUF433 family)